MMLECQVAALTLTTLPRHDSDFTLTDSDGKTVVVRWAWEPSKPKSTKNGITGWAWVDGVFDRIHVCAHNPCTAEWPASKYGDMPAPRHFRLWLRGEWMNLYWGRSSVIVKSKQHPRYQRATQNNYTPP